MAEQWVLIAALAVTLMMLVFHETRKAGPALSINEAVQLVNTEGGIFVDVRDAADFGRGHITNAVNIPSASLAGRMSELEKFREKPVVVVCKMGQSAAGAQPVLLRLRRASSHARSSCGICLCCRDVVVAQGRERPPQTGPKSCICQRYLQRRGTLWE